MRKMKTRITKNNPWFYLLIGSIGGLIIAILLLKKSYCLNAYQPSAMNVFPGLAAIGIALAVLSTLIKDDLFKGNNFSKKYKSFFLVIGSLLFISAIAAWLSPLFYQFDKNYCAPDFTKLVSLTDQEGIAVINKDMNIIGNIYSPNAIVTRMDPRQSWPAYSYYANKFATEVHCTNSHGNYIVTSFTSDEVIMTTSSQGTWGILGQGCNQVFDNPSGSDQWTFDRIDGTWKIVNFEFNLPHK